MRAVFFRLLEAEDKAATLLSAIRSPLARVRYEVDLTLFAGMPRSSFAYWAPAGMQKAFTAFPPFQGRGRVVASTNPLNLDFRYARVWWEVDADDLNRTWRP